MNKKEKKWLTLFAIVEGLAIGFLVASFV